MLLPQTLNGTHTYTHTHTHMRHTKLRMPPTAGPGADELSARLLDASRRADGDAVAQLLQEGADPGWAAPADGVTPLMAAAEAGSEPIVTALLEAGAPWQAQDAEGHTAGEYATAGPNRALMQVLLDYAVRCEMLLGAAARADRPTNAAVNSDYLSSKLEYQDGKLLDGEGEAVMMEWERELMVRHAEIICAGGGDVLNVGFGMGIIDGEIQKLKPRSHTIIEAHPDVYAHACEQGWDRRPGVTLVFGRWQDVIAQLGPFDGVFFDTYGEYYEDMRDFHEALPTLLRPGGVYSFFNGLAPDNLFFHLVYGEIARRELNALGLSVRYDAVPMDASADKIWEGVKNRYWHLPVYFIPTCVLGEAAAAAAAGGGERETEKGAEAGET